jgi:apolipoprotein N-acyltransferase
VRNVLPADYVLIAAVALIACANLYYGPRIPQKRIAMQWGLDGKPTWYAPKSAYLWGILAFVILVRAMIWAFVTYAPQTVHGLGAGIISFAITVALAHIFILKRAAG